MPLPASLQQPCRLFDHAVHRHLHAVQRRQALSVERGPGVLQRRLVGHAQLQIRLSAQSSGQRDRSERQRAPGDRVSGRRPELWPIDHHRPGELRCSCGCLGCLCRPVWLSAGRRFRDSADDASQRLEPRIVRAGLLAGGQGINARSRGSHRKGDPAGSERRQGPSHRFSVERQNRAAAGSSVGSRPARAR